MILNFSKTKIIAIVILALCVSVVSGLLAAHRVHAQSADGADRASQACIARGDLWDGSTGRCLPRVNNQAACQTAGGSWRQTQGAPQGVMDCYCPAGNAITSGVCPSAGGAGNNNEPGYMPNDCNDPNGINEDNCGIIRYLVIFINVLSAVVGLVVVGSIIYGGIQYSMAGSDPQKVSEAKRRIRNAVIALMFFLFMFSLLNYLVPGGVLR